MTHKLDMPPALATRIIAETCAAHRVASRDMLDARVRLRNVVAARGEAMRAMASARNHAYSHISIARVFGVSHSVVIYHTRPPEYRERLAANTRLAYRNRGVS